MKKNLVQKNSNKTNLLKSSDLNELKYTKNSILKSNRKSMDKRLNDVTSNNKLKKRIIDKGMYTRQNSNKLMETLQTNRRNLSNKKLFLSNSYQKREKIHKTSAIINNNTKSNNLDNFKLNSNKTNNNFKHQKLLSLQENKNPKNNIQISIKNPKLNEVIYKPNLPSVKYKDFFTLINKDKDNKIKNNKISYNKSNFQQGKILHKSLEQRNKISKFKLSQNIKSKILKNKIAKKDTGKKEKSENFFIKPFIINNPEVNYTYRNKPPSKIETCQTFSKEENIKNKENNNSNNDTNNISENNKNENLLKININNNNEPINEHVNPKTSTSKENKKIAIKEREFKTPIASKSVEKYQKLKNLIEDYCTNDNKHKRKYTSISMKTKNNKHKNNTTSFNKNKNNLTSGNLIQKESKGIKQYIYHYNIVKHVELLNLKKIEAENKNNDIFEVISDIKVKSLNEYEEEKKADEKSKIFNTTPNENKINNNININININYNNININNQTDKENKINKENKENSINISSSSDNNINIKNKDNINHNFNNGVFIEDRDEYDSLKETFSKDRFSFRPINEENNQIPTNLKKYNNNVNNIIYNNNFKISDKNLLTKKDFGNCNIINSNILNNNKNKKNSNNNKLDNKNLMKKEISKLNKLKKIIKNKPNSKLLKDSKILNRSVELRNKKINKY